MRRNREEVKAALAVRLEEYNAKKRAKRKMCVACAVAVLTASVTVSAIPTLIANQRVSYRDAGMDTVESAAVDGAADIIQTLTDGVGAIKGSTEGFDEVTESDNKKSETLQNGEKSDGTEVPFVGFPRHPVAIISEDRELTFLPIETGENIIEVLRTAEKKDAAWDYSEVVMKLFVSGDKYSCNVSVTRDGNVICGGEYYAVKDGEKLLRLLEIGE